MMDKQGHGEPSDQLYVPIDKHSHRNALRAVLDVTTGPVLELGCGPGSTGWLHDATGDRPLLSMDHHKDWMMSFALGTHLNADGTPMFSGPLVDDRHEFRHVEEWREACEVCHRPWSVALVDTAPPNSRAWLLLQLAWACQYIVVHDTETYQYRVGPTLAKFVWQVTDRSALPFTTVVSNFRRIPAFKTTVGEP